MASDYDWGLTPQAIEDVKQGMAISVGLEVTAAMAPAILMQGKEIPA